MLQHITTLFKRLIIMNKEINYLDNVDFAATVCDSSGIVLYQNTKATQRDGNVTGRNLYDCHNAKSGEMIRHMIESGGSNTYETASKGQRRLIHQTPWRDTEGKVAGLIELSIDLP